MSRLTFSTTDNFNCKLTCDRCSHIKSNGQRCRIRVCFGYPTCWIHTKQVYGVKLRPSTIPNVEKGLFAESRDFAAGDWICPYIGEIITEQCLNQRYGDATAPYAVDDSRRRYIDSACQRGIGSMANGLFNPDGTSRNEACHNALIVDRFRMGKWLQATRQIRDGSEIFVYYGPDYRIENNHMTSRNRIADNRPC